MREVLEICRLDGEWVGDIEPIIVTKYLTKNELRRLAIKNIVKTCYDSGEYAVMGNNGEELLFTFHFDRW